MRHIFIINPAAGKKDGRQRVYAMAEALKKNHDLDIECMLTKSRGHAMMLTRAIAETQRFGNARKRDSQDICFAPDGDYAAAIGRLTGEKSVPGAFVSTDGRVLGEHKGIIHYTVGQRRGLGISHGERLYVCRIDPERNEVVLGEEKDLYRSEAAVSDVNWISGETPREPVRCAVKIRYRAREQAATVYPEENGRGRIVFDAPQCAVTPGQAAVFYDGNTVLGGGTIE